MSETPDAPEWPLGANATCVRSLSYYIKFDDGLGPVLLGHLDDGESGGMWQRERQVGKEEKSGWFLVPFSAMPWLFLFLCTFGCMVDSIPVERDLCLSSSLPRLHIMMTASFSAAFHLADLCELDLFISCLPLKKMMTDRRMSSPQNTLCVVCSAFLYSDTFEGRDG